MKITCGILPNRVTNNLVLLFQVVPETLEPSLQLAAAVLSQVPNFLIDIAILSFEFGCCDLN